MATSLLTSNLFTTLFPLRWKIILKLESDQLFYPPSVCSCTVKHKMSGLSAPLGHILVKTAVTQWFRRLFCQNNSRLIILSLSLPRNCAEALTTSSDGLAEKTARQSIILLLHALGPDLSVRGRAKNWNLFDREQRKAAYFIERL